MCRVKVKVTHESVDLINDELENRKVMPGALSASSTIVLPHLHLILFLLNSSVIS